MGPSDVEFHSWFVPRELDASDIQRVVVLREQFKRTLAVILNNVPASAHRTDAVRELHKACRAAVFAYTHRPQEPADV